MRVVSHRECLFSIARTRVGWHGDGWEGMLLFLALIGAYPPDQKKAVFLRHAEISKEDVGAALASRVKSVRRGRHRACCCSARLNQQHQKIPYVTFIVDDEDVERGERLGCHDERRARRT